MARSAWTVSRTVPGDEEQEHHVAGSAVYGGNASAYGDMRVSVPYLVV